MSWNKAREEIFMLITDAESNAGVPSGVLANIYELEESLVHLRRRKNKDKIDIKKIIFSKNNFDNTKLWQNEITRPGDN